MSVRHEIPAKDGMYFITITCYQWLSLFEMTEGYDVVYNWFDYLKKQEPLYQWLCDHAQSSPCIDQFFQYWKIDQQDHW